MSEIIKNRAVVLKKLDYGDSSKIASFYTEDYGKISGIIKGARSPKSRIGKIVDPLNIIDLVYYDKPSRDLQIITEADLVFHPSKIFSKLDNLKYASAAIELIEKIAFEYQPHPKLFRGITRIIELFNKSEEKPDLLFLKFFLFFVIEMGYSPQLENCTYCGNKDLSGIYKAFNFEYGLVCKECSEDHLVSYNFEPELFNFLICLRSRNEKLNYNQEYVEKLIGFLERYLKFHIPEYKGLKSLNMF